MDTPEQLFQRHWRAARAVAYGVTADWTSAEDAAAEGFFEALQNLHTLSDPNRFGAWLRTIVVRKAQKAAGARNRFAQLPEDLAENRHHHEERIYRQQLAAAVQEAVTRLPEHLREAIALVYFEGYEQQRAAEFLDIPDGTLRRRLHEGRERLRDLVGAETSIPGAILRMLARKSPPSRDLVIRLFGKPDASAAIGSIRETLAQPYSVLAQTIRQALPQFQEWHLDAANAFGQVVPLPPGFREGKPGYWLRFSRGLISNDGRGVIEHLRDSSRLPQGMRLTETLELTWMTSSPMDLRDVREFLGKLAIDAQITFPPRFESYAEPRFRSALQLHFDRRAAIGGVLHDTDVAHVRIFVDAWKYHESK